MKPNPIRPIPPQPRAVQSVGNSWTRGCAHTAPFVDARKGRRRDAATGRTVCTGDAVQPSALAPAARLTGAVAPGLANPPITNVRPTNKERPRHASSRVW